jgi:hypothetical protein
MPTTNDSAASSTGQTLPDAALATVDAVDAKALAWARRGQEQLIHAEEHAEAVRADFRRAVRRLAANGSSPRGHRGRAGAQRSAI